MIVHTQCESLEGAAAAAHRKKGNYRQVLAGWPYSFTKQAFSQGATQNML